MARTSDRIQNSGTAFWAFCTPGTVYRVMLWNIGPVVGDVMPGEPDAQYHHLGVAWHVGRDHLEKGQSVCELSWELVKMT